MSSVIYNILSVVVLLLTLFLGAYVYLNDRKNIVNRIFALLNFGAVLWIFSNLMTDSSKSLYLVEFWSKMTIIGPIFIGYFLYQLSSVFPRKREPSNLFQNALLFIIAVFLFFVPTEFNVSRVFIQANNVPTFEPGILYLFFLLYFILLILASFRNLYRDYHTYSNYEKLQVQYISLGLGCSIIFGSITNLVLPLIGDSGFVNYGPYFIIFFVLFTSYAIVKYKMFDIKVITAQLLVLSLWVFVLIRALLSDNQNERYLNIALLIILIVVGTLLIRSVMKEVRQRERIELLAADLRKANSRLTELNKQKSEFVSFATHQLRAPLTAMKGYASLILEGDLGKINGDVRGAIARIFESTNTLTSIVDDYLNLTRIELGTLKYVFETIDLRQMVSDVIAELKPSIEKSKLQFMFTIDDSVKDWRISADRDKLKQVITNLVDNAIKYTPSGSVAVSLAWNAEKNRFVFKIKDTGIGISPEIMPRLFQKFTRAGNANKANTKGTGLGLYVAKEIIHAHHGEITAESEGEGKGSAFTVEFEPLHHDAQ